MDAHALFVRLGQYVVHIPGEEGRQSYDRTFQTSFSPPSNSVRSWVRAPCNRDITVPSGMLRTSAISAYDKSWKSLRTRISRPFGVIRDIELQIRRRS